MKSVIALVSSTSLDSVEGTMANDVECDHHMTHWIA